MNTIRLVLFFLSLVIAVGLVGTSLTLMSYQAGFTDTCDRLHGSCKTSIGGFESSDISIVLFGLAALLISVMMALWPKTTAR